MARRLRRSDRAAAAGSVPAARMVGERDVAGGGNVLGPADNLYL
jgi:hypothetical protein